VQFTAHSLKGGAERLWNAIDCVCVNGAAGTDTELHLLERHAVE